MTAVHGRRFTGRVALVTGASRGIGLAVAQRLVDEGARVVITARKPEGLAAAVGQLGADAAIAVPGRADDPAHQDEAIATAAREFARLDVLVNNTGINPVYGPLLDLDEGAARKIMEVNVLAALGWTRRAVAAGLGADGRGAVVNMASVAGLAPAPGLAYYGVSKAALISLTVQLAAELSPAVRVNALGPGFIETETTLGREDWRSGRREEVLARTPLRRIPTPEDIVAPVLFLASEDSAHLTGAFLVYDGGFSMPGA